MKYYYCSEYIAKGFEGRQESPFNKGAVCEADWGFFKKYLRTLRQSFGLPAMHKISVELTDVR